MTPNSTRRELQLPEKLQKAHSSINHILKNNDFISLSEVVETMLTHIEHQARGLRPKFVLHSQEYLAEQVFRHSFNLKDLKSQVLVELSTTIHVLKLIQSDVRAHIEKNDLEQLRVCAEILREVIFEYIVYESSFYTEARGLNVYYGFMKRMATGSESVYLCSKMLLENRIYPNTIGEYVVRPTAVFLIRQALELKLKNAFGIHLIFDKRTGKFLKFPAEKLINLIEDDSQEMLFPVKKSVVQKIHRWTQAYVHGGYMPNIWQIMFAQHLLSPLFRWGEGRAVDDNRPVNSMHGAVKFSRSFYDNIPKMIAERVVRQDLNNLEIERHKSPECVIMDA